MAPLITLTGPLPSASLAETPFNVPAVTWVPPL